MKKQISEYYYEELNAWEKSISFYKVEMKIVEDKLQEIILRNTIVDIAAKVEAHQVLLNEIKDNFKTLSVEIISQQEKLKPDIKLIADELMNSVTELLQTNLRKKLQKCEKEYIDIKYYCYDFISETLKK